ncbi:MAG: hypothetical protein Q9187_009368 [Circinaria calcarea]
MESPTVKEKEDGYAGQGSLSPVQAHLPTDLDSLIRESDNSYAAGHPEQPADVLAPLTDKPVVSGPSHKLLEYPQYSFRSSDQHTHPAFGYSPHHPAFANNSYNHTAGYQQAAPGPTLAQHPYTHAPDNPQTVSRYLQAAPGYYPQSAPGYSAQYHQQPTSGIEYSPHRPGLLNQFSVPIYPTPHPHHPTNFAHQSVPNYNGGDARKQGPLAKQAEKRSVKHLTCYYWYKEGPCRWTEDQCAYAHVWTGKVAEKPVTLRQGRRSRSTQQHRKYTCRNDWQHLYTLSARRGSSTRRAFLRISSPNPN